MPLEHVYFLPFSDLFALNFTHFPCFLIKPRPHFFDLGFFGFEMDSIGDDKKLPTPSNVTLAGVAKIGGAAGTP